MAAFERGCKAAYVLKKDWQEITFGGDQGTKNHWRFNATGTAGLPNKARKEARRNDVVQLA